MQKQLYSEGGLKVCSIFVELFVKLIRVDVNYV
jgi:hypothetical protein